MEVLLIRHGETDYNKNRRFSGLGDIGLNSTGKGQALRLADALRDERIDILYSSDLKRCVETGENIRAGTEKIYTRNLREMNFGHWEGLTYEEIKARYPDELNEWEQDWIGYAIPEGESFEEMGKRVIKEFRGIIERHNDSSRVALISHSGCIRIILGEYIIGSLKDIWKFQVDNAAVTRLYFADNHVYLKSLNERRFD